MAHNLQVGTTARYVSGEFDYVLTGGDALYYGDQPGVSVSSNIGTLAVGERISRASNSYIVSAGTSYVNQVSRSTPGGVDIVNPADGTTPTYDSTLKRFTLKSPGAEFNVLDYGAISDGTTDDTAAFQAAIDAAEAAGGGVVLIPAGDYAIATGLTMTSGVNLKGEGPSSRLLFADVATYGIDMQGTATNVTAATVNISSGDQTVTVADSSAFAVGDQVMVYATASVVWGRFVTWVTAASAGTITLASPIPYDLTTANGATIRRHTVRVGDCTLSDFACVGTGGTNRIYFIVATIFENLSIERCTFDNLGGDSCSAIWVNNGINLRIADCIIDRHTGSVASLPIQLYGTTQTVVTGCASTRSSGGVAFSSCPYGVISDNTFSGNVLSGQPTRGIKLYASPGSVVANNVVRDFADLDYNPTALTGIRLTNAVDCAVVGNTVERCGTGISVDYTAAEGGALSVRCVVANNVIKDSYFRGLVANSTPQGDIAHHNITGNIIDRVDYASQGSADAIRVSVSECIISNNVLREWGDLADTNVGIRTNDSNGSIITGNYGDNSGTGTFIEASAGTNSIINNNMISPGTAPTTVINPDATDLVYTNELVPTSDTDAIMARVRGDAYPRFAVTPTTLKFGPGTGTTDTTLERSAAGILRLTNTVLNAERTSGSSAAIYLKTAGESIARVEMRGNGAMFWSDGTTQDTAYLYRNTANVLTYVNGKLTATNGIGVGNSAAATTLGSVTKKMEVFDAGGTSLGFVPIYDAIT